MLSGTPEMATVKVSAPACKALPAQSPAWEHENVSKKYRIFTSMHYLCSKYAAQRLLGVEFARALGAEPSGRMPLGPVRCSHRYRKPDCERHSDCMARMCQAGSAGLAYLWPTLNPKP